MTRYPLKRNTKLVKSRPYSNLFELEDIASSVFLNSAWNWIQSGTEREITSKLNKSIFSLVKLLPSVLEDVSDVDFSTDFCEEKLSSRLIVAPMGHLSAFAPKGELVVAAAANAAGSLAFASCLGRFSLEAYSTHTHINQFGYQLYPFGDRIWILDQIEKASHYGAKSVCLTLDSTVRSNVYGKSDIDLRAFGEPGTGVANIQTDLRSKFTWKDLEWVLDRTEAKIILKGLWSPNVTKRLMDLGAAGVWISNHGGRALDSNIHPVEILRQSRATIDKNRKAENANFFMITDGGVRCGTDMLKLLAMGSDFVAIGRPILYALALGGERDVKRVINILKDELNLAARLAGVNGIEKIRALSVEITHG